MTWGVATALLEQHGEEGLFEVDEAWLPRVASQLEPGLIVLGNLFRDQLDRYGELEKLADEWAKLVEIRAGRMTAEEAASAAGAVLVEMRPSLVTTRSPSAAKVARPVRRTEAVEEGVLPLKC